MAKEKTLMASFRDVMYWLLAKKRERPARAMFAILGPAGVNSCPPFCFITGHWVFDKWAPFSLVLPVDMQASLLGDLGCWSRLGWAGSFTCSIWKCRLSWNSL